MVAAVPQIPKISIFSLGGASYIEDIVNIKIVPVDPEESTITTLDGVAHKDVGVTTWQIELEAVQDWDSARPGLAWYCWTNLGTSKVFILKHESGTESASNPKFTGTCIIKALGYMGDGGVFATSTAVFPITGTLTLDATP
jgi:hypothetical protein